MHTLEFLQETLKQQNQKLKDELAEIKRAHDTIISDNVDKHKNYIGSTLHSLKGELANIRFAADNLFELLEKSETAKSDYDLLVRSCDYSYILLQRAMNSLDVGRPKVEVINLKRTLDRINDLIRPRLPEKIHLRFVIEKDRPSPLVMGNPIQLLGIFYEFIENSITALREDGGDIEIRLKEAKGKAVLKISDSGAGIPEEIKDKIFKEQLPSNNGSGLGLLLNYQAIKGMGGTLKLKSVRGKGTDITVIFPTIQGEESDDEIVDS